MNNCDYKTELKKTNNISDIERSIIKKYRKELWTKFIKGLKEFDLVQNNDKIAVCISGGKDSLLMAKLFQEYQKHVNPTIELEFISMDPGFSDFNRQMLEQTCKDLNINLKIYDSEIFKVVDKIASDYPCYMCARMRRGALYSYAQDLGCNKIALGHHYDDFIETIMLNVLYGGKYQAMMPKLKASNFEGIELIRPLVYLREKDIIKYNDNNKINNMNCGCVVAAKQTSSKRTEVKELINRLSQNNKDVENSIFASSLNVNVDAVLGWKINGEKKSFLNEYNGKI